MDVIIIRPEFLSTNNDIALITHKVLTSEHDKHVKLITQPKSAHRGNETTKDAILKTEHLCMYDMMHAYRHKNFEGLVEWSSSQNR